jgi:hypothetical protein
MSKKAADRKAATAVIDAIRDGMDSKKCRRCAQMVGAVELTEQVFSNAKDPNVVELADTVKRFREELGKTSYKDLGCSGCSGAKVRRKLSAGFEVPKKKGGKAVEPVEIRADEPKAPREGKRPPFEVEVQADPPLIRCKFFDKKGSVVAIVSGLGADSVAATAVGKKLVKNAAVAARLGVELARAEASLRG